MRTRRVGTLSMGIVLLVTGLGLLYAQINEKLVLDWAAKWWPLIFILLGAEVLWQSWRANKNDIKFSYDVLGVFIIIILLGFGLTMDALRETGVIEQCKISMISRNYDLIRTADPIPIDSALNKVVIEQSEAPLEIISGPADQITASCKADVTAPSRSQAMQILQQSQGLQTRREGNTLFITFASMRSLHSLGSGITDQSNTIYLPEQLQVCIYSGVPDLKIHAARISNDWYINGVNNAAMDLPASSNVQLLAQTNTPEELQGNAAWAVKEIPPAGNTDPEAEPARTEGRLALGSGKYKINISSSGPVSVDVLP